LSNLGLERFFMELVRILTRSMLQKSLWHQHRSCLWFRLEDEKQLVPYGYIGELFGYKKDARSKLMSNVRRIFGEWFREKITRNPKFLLVGIVWDQVYEANKVEMRGESTSWWKLIFFFPTRGRDHLKTKLVRGSISCTSEIKKY
jgi:hypothetical protein